jgi:hypothetical protein
MPGRWLVPLLWIQPLGLVLAGEATADSVRPDARGQATPAQVAERVVTNADEDLPIRIARVWGAGKQTHVAVNVRNAGTYEFRDIGPRVHGVRLACANAGKGAEQGHRRPLWAPASGILREPRARVCSARTSGAVLVVRRSRRWSPAASGLSVGSKPCSCDRSIALPALRSSHCGAV